MLQPSALKVREARFEDLEAIRLIYNEGIADGIATLDEDPKAPDEIVTWWADHGGRYAVLVAESTDAAILGWASLNPYSHRCAYRGVADLSVYVARRSRGTGVGSALLRALEKTAKGHDFHKIVLFTLPFNDGGQRLYRRNAYREVGVFKEQGRLDGHFVDVMAMEKILRRSVLFVCRHNTGRSQMAEAYLRAFSAGTVDVASAGTIAADAPNDVVVAAMNEDGIDISRARPKLIDARIAAQADLIITMGCDVQGIPKVDDDWALRDPKNEPIAVVREIRDEVKAKARALYESLRAG
ncbi:MAG TPA: arsinothricin resistance N-acetyltransferase ArsN1 family A [Candidatus Elarobacter sp.]|jgi:phosphinothricin acetyltransferase|nr:arsinothricin resistance N-acetyltransferase ArsN1 family A [Candidatus Elarobacter sp.]